MNRVNLVASKTYATFENAVRAVESVYHGTDLRYAVVCDDAGRYFVIFLGTDGLRHGVHHAGHCIVS